MGLADFQQNVDRLTRSWSDKKAEFMMLLLTEEVGELARAIRKTDKQRLGHENEAAGSRQDIVEELGDVLFLLARISLIAGVDLGDAAQAVLEKIARRIALSG